MGLPGRFWEKVQWTSQCWLWTGAIDTRGYGSYWLGRDDGLKRAHRVAYSALIGPIPEGLDLDHLCRVRRCVNPHHLEPVTRVENLARSPFTYKGGLPEKDFCVNGHPRTEQNAYPRPDANGGWKCRECTRAAGSRYRARKKAAHG